jgi:Ala-tRNA(Pro) deacylase
MGISISLEHYLNNYDIDYEVMVHKRTATTARSADVCQVPLDSMAKGVLLKTRQGYCLAVIPASRDVELNEVGAWLDQPVGLASEEEISRLFADCEPGAIPPVGDAFGIATLVDDDLETQPIVYFEGGDHQSVVHVSGGDFQRMMEDMPHGHFSKQR